MFITIGEGLHKQAIRVDEITRVYLSEIENYRLYVGLKNGQYASFIVRHPQSELERITKLLTQPAPAPEVAKDEMPLKKLKEGDEVWVYGMVSKVLGDGDVDVMIRWYKGGFFHFTVSPEDVRRNPPEAR